MKRAIFFTVIVFSLITVNCNAGNPENKGNTSKANGAVSQLTNDSFKKMVFNYELNKEWKYEGDKPAIIDFYADWCAPCRQLSPLVDEVAKEYEGKIVVYKVDTMKEKLLTEKLGITSLPTLLFIPAKGKPQVSLGAIPKESLVKAINEVLLVK